MELEDEHLPFGVDEGVAPHVPGQDLGKGRVGGSSRAGWRGRRVEEQSA